jgi:hypothetical protein
MVRAVAALVLAGALCRCGAASGPMVAGPAPSGWEAELAAERAAKDRRYRESPESPLIDADRRAFRGLDYWPADPGFRFVGALEVNERLERFTIVTTTGKPRPCEKYGRVRLATPDAVHTLQVYRLLDVAVAPGREAFFLPFLDATSGVETYPAGRYVDLEGPNGGPYVLDFNRAYNPLCAYGDAERFACPRTPEENRLPIRVEAGERGYKRETATP